MINNLQEKNDQVIQNIKTLQTTEMNLYNSLDSQSLTTDQKKKIINQINEISQMRINLYNILKNNYSGYKENVSFSRNMLNDQLVSVDFIEDELNESKRRLNLIEEQKNNKIRLVEINTYYGKQYNAHKKIMQIIVIMCIPILILNILANKELIPSKLNILLNVIIIVLGLTIIGYNIIDISNRSNMNFDEYSWQFNKEEALNSTPSSNIEINDINSDPWGMRLPEFTCIGAECCNNTSAYDEMLNKCIPFS
jgi:hypothetical protein